MTMMKSVSRRGPPLERLLMRRSAHSAVIERRESAVVARAWRWAYPVGLSHGKSSGWLEARLATVAWS